MDNNSNANKYTASSFSSYLNINLVRNVILFSGGIIVFIFGVIAYGIILNLNEVPLKEAMANKGFTKLENPSILIDRRSYSLELFEDTVLIKTYRANFGRNVGVPKTRAGDLATPVGEYKICSIDSSSKYYKFFRINYPNLNDAENALRIGVINQTEFDKLKFEYYYSDCTDGNTPLGGDIGIQGIGRLDFLFRYLPFNYNWTDGSIAVSNESMNELYSVVKKGTKVVIK